jgi:Transposase
MVKQCGGPAMNGGGHGHRAARLRRHRLGGAAKGSDGAAGGKAAEGSTEHQVCLTGADGPIQRTFTHDAGGIGAMVDWLCAQSERPEHVAVAIEMPHGPVVEALMDRGIVVFAINPKQLDRFRDRFSPAGAKLTAGTPSCWPLPCALTATVSAVWKRWIQLSWSFANGRAWPRSSSRNGFA